MPYALAKHEVGGSLHDVFGLVDEKFGPIKSIVGFKSGTRQPPWWVFRAQLSRPLGQYYVEYDCDAWGAALEKDQALFKCLGEALERYCMQCSLFLDHVEFRPASDCPFINELPKCAQEERCSSNFKGIQPDWLLSQVQVKEVATDLLHWLPAGFIHFAFKAGPQEKSVAISHSSGSAFHQTLHQAIWSGLCEVAERDAFSLFWLNQYPAREIIVDDMCGQPDLGRRLAAMRDAGLSVRWFDITTDFKVPTVIAISVGSEYPYFTFGAACCADPYKALCKAVDEVNLVRSAQIAGKDSADAPSFEQFDWVHDLRDHSDLYALWKNTPAFEFFAGEGKPKTSLSEFASKEFWQEPANYEELKGLCSALQTSLGLTVLYSENTLDDVAKIGVAVKVVVPQMVPISVPETAKWLGVARLDQHACKHQLKKGSNPYPHPFP